MTFAFQQQQRLVPLRDDLDLMPGAATVDGAPSWTVHDAAANRHVRLGWLEVEVLARWALGDPALIAQAISAGTTLSPSTDDVIEIARFIERAGFTRALGPAGTQRMLAMSHAGRHGWGTWLLHNYLFLRLPLLQPDAALTRAMPHLDFLFRPLFWILVAWCGFLGAAQVLRHWTEFTHGASFLFSVEGAIAAFVALSLSKCVHELGHALVAKRHGVAVPTMGVAVMVLWPVLYTDTNGAWRLTSRRARLQIGAAGMAAELALACFATLAWSVAPDGETRSALFLLASATWLTTLAVNLNPLMRFDGYFLLSDLLDVANLQQRAFALGRWRLRALLFGTRERVPETMPAERRRILIAYAWATWIYRVVLFTGIAVLVYQHAFKLLGIFLFAVEIGWFIALPVWREAQHWHRRRGELVRGGNARRSLFVVFLLLALVLLPWRGEVDGGAWLRAETQTQLYAPRGSRIAELHVRPGQRVAAGEVLVVLESPDLSWQRTRLESEARALSDEVVGGTASAALMQKNDVTWNQLRSALAALEGTREQAGKLTLTAPHDAIVAEMADDLAVGDWVAADERLLLLRSAGAGRIEAFVDEGDLARLSIGAAAQFHPDTGGAPVPAHVIAIDAGTVRALPHAELAADEGGPIAAKRNDDGQLLPERALTRVVLATDDGIAPTHVARGVARIDAERSAKLFAWARRAYAVLVRESGF
ncbi:MAG: hemolysin [Rhodospirillales bacterium]|nr:hemolysin [Rhodospirillales bacterium]